MAAAAAAASSAPPKKIVAPTVSQINAEFVTQVGVGLGGSGGDRGWGWAIGHGARDAVSAGCPSPLQLAHRYWAPHVQKRLCFDAKVSTAHGARAALRCPAVWL